MSDNTAHQNVAIIVEWLNRGFKPFQTLAAVVSLQPFQGLMSTLGPTMKISAQFH